MIQEPSYIPTSSEPGTLFILSGPSGAGKSSLVEEVINRLQSRYSVERFVTYTSRSPRQGEQHGKDFYFLSPDAFKVKIAASEFLEVSDALGTYYGTHKEVKERLAAGRSGFLVIDRHGASRLKALFSNALLIWVTVPSLKTLEERLIKRGTETSEQVDRRLRRAAQEIAEEVTNPLYQCSIENEDFELAVENLKQIVETRLRADKSF